MELGFEPRQPGMSSVSQLFWVEMGVEVGQRAEALCVALGSVPELGLGVS